MIQSYLVFLIDDFSDCSSSHYGYFCKYSQLDFSFILTVKRFIKSATEVYYIAKKRIKKVFCKKRSSNHKNKPKLTQKNLKRIKLERFFVIKLSFKCCGQIFIIAWLL